MTPFPLDLVVLTSSWPLPPCQLRAVFSTPPGDTPFYTTSEICVTIETFR